MLALIVSIILSAPVSHVQKYLILYVFLLSIKLGWDNELRTNRWHKRNQTKDIEYEFKKGQEIGEFNLGSTIVLIYEVS